MKKIHDKLGRGDFDTNAHIVKISLSLLVIIAFSIMGLLFFARPTVSESEKRRLTEFPSFTLESFMSGDYFSQISLWYSDTYPTREAMINANLAFKSLYGTSDGDVIISSPTGSGGVQDGGAVNRFGNIYIQSSTHTAYEIFQNTQSKNDRYIGAVNSAAQALGSGVNVYNMVVPLHYTYRLTDEQISSIGASDCIETISYIYSGLDSNVTAVDVHGVLSEHMDEYIYFRTDHHWTARGAYYAYVAFCQKKGISPMPLSSYEKLEFGGFLGTYYEQSGNSEILKSHPDTVEAFVPKGTNTITVTTRDGKQENYSIVNRNTDTYYAAAGSKYNCFIAGDFPLAQIHNPNINDGSSIVVVKESYGNAFVPFLVDSYEYVYVVDYRYYTGSLAGLVKERGIDDVLFLNYVSTASTESKIEKLEGII